MSNNKFILDVDVKPLKLQLREATLELQRAQQKFGEMSDAAILASRKVAAIKDAMEQAMESAKLFDPGSRFQAITTFANQAAAGVSAFQGAMALVGTESKEVEKTLLKVQGAMALSQGLSELKDFGKSWNQLRISATAAMQSFASSAAIGATKAANGIFKALGMSVSTSATSFKVLRGAIISTGIGALVVAIGYAINKLMEWTDKTNTQVTAEEQLKKEENKLKDAIEQTNKQIERRNQIMDYTTKLAVAEAKLAGKTAKEQRDIMLQGVNDKKYAAQVDEENARKRKEQLVADHEWEKEKWAMYEGYSEEYIKERKKQMEKETKEAEDDYNAKVIARENFHQEVRLLELENQTKDKEEEEKAAEDKAKKQEERNQKALARQKEAQDILYEARKKLMTEKEAEEADVEKKFKEDKLKLKEAGIKDFAVLEKAKEEELKKIREKYAQLDKEKEEEKKKIIAAFNKEIADIEYETKVAGMIEARDKEKAQMEKDFADRRQAILDNAEYDAIQKEQLLAKNLERENAIRTEFANKGIVEDANREFERLNTIVENESLSFAARTKAVEDEVALNQSLYDRKLISQDEYNRKKKELADAEIDIEAQKQEAIQQYGQIGLQAVQTLQGLARKNSVGEKALAVAQATISTYLAITKALARESGTKPTPLAIASAVAAGVFGFIQVAKIISTPIPGGDGAGGGNPPSPSGGAPSGIAAPQTISATPITALSDVNPQQGRPIRAFVVENEVTSVQNRVADIERRSGF